MKLNFVCVCTIFVYINSNCLSFYTVSVCVTLGFIRYISGLCVHIFEIANVAMGGDCLWRIYIAYGWTQYGHQFANNFDEMVWRRPSIVSVEVDAFFHKKPLSILIIFCFLFSLQNAEKMRAPKRILTRWSTIRLHILFYHWFRLHGNLCLEFFALIASIGLQFVKWRVFEWNTLSRWCGKTLAGMTLRRAEPIFQFESLSMLRHPSTKKAHFNISIWINEHFSFPACPFRRDIEKIKTGLAEDVSHFLNLMFSFVICVVISFIYGWKLTLIVISYLPLVFATNIIIGKVSF